MITVTEREEKVVNMRAKGMNFREIGNALNLSVSRARQIFKRAELKLSSKDWHDGLRIREINRLTLGAGIQSRRELIIAVLEAKVHPDGRIKGFGKSSYNHVMEWLVYSEAPSLLRDELERAWRSAV